jgi:hypothetical protein
MTAAKAMQAAVLDIHGVAFRVAFPVRAERVALAYSRELGRAISRRGCQR